MAFCPSCGSALAAGSASCPKCGASGGASSAPPPPVVSMPSPASYSPPPFQGGMVLPDVSPLAIILAAAAWVLGGPLLSLPAMFIARSDIRGCREGRYNPNGLSQSQLAFWIAAINVLLGLLACVAFVLFFVFAAGVVGVAGAAAAKDIKEMEAIRVEMEGRQYSALETEIDTGIAGRSAREQELWRSVKGEWQELKKKNRGSGMFPGSVKTEELLRLVSSDRRLWQALVTAEAKVAAECGYAKPFRTRSSLPSESTPSTGDDDD
ncbi:MAG: zinc ribbon domain-containing protein [Planctomycetes bacterium]|nr:zinc ribbon domain-containing protein [Planctomycetota bacterium]